MRPDSPPPSVLHLSQKMGVGGLERVIVELAAAQSESGSARPYVYAYDEGALETGLIPELKLRGIPIEWRVKPPGFSLRTVNEIYEFCRRHRISILHSHDLNALLYASFVKARSLGAIRVVHTQHSFLHVASKKQAFYERVFPRFADRIVCPAPSLASTYAQFGAFESRIRIVPNPVKWSSGSLSELEPEYRARLPKGPSHRRLLVLGRVHPGKGQERLLDLWPYLSEEFRRNKTLIFMGPSTDADYRARLEARARTLPNHENLLWFDRTDRPLAWMRECEVFVSLSDFEGMPLAPLEAFGEAVPLVLSDIPGHRDLGLPTAQFVATAPSVENARIFERAVTTAPKPSASQIAKIRAQHDPAAVARAYLGVYREALGETSA